MENEKGKKFYEQANSIHNLMMNFEFMYKQCLKLGRVECDLLQFLLREKRAVSMKEVAQFMDVSHSRITHLMDSLIKKNYLKRIPSKEDRRVFYAEITPDGKEIAKKYKEKNIKMFEDFLKKMPEEQIEPIYDTLTYWKQFLIKMNEVLMDSRNA